VPARRRKSARPVLPEIADDIWRALFVAADSFAQLKLWDFMGDGEMIGTRDPRDGQPVLATVMGLRREVFGLAIHYGPAGLRWALEIATSPDLEPDMEDFLSIHVLKVELVKKSELSPEEKRRFQELGFAPSGGRSARWPTFQSQFPSHMPWHINAEEAVFLQQVLPQLTAVGAAVVSLFANDDERVLDGFPFWPKDHPLDEPLTTEQVEWNHVRMPAELPAIPIQMGPEALKRTQALPQNPELILEVDAFHIAPVAGDDGRPWLPKMGMATINEGGFIAGMVMAEQPQDSADLMAARALLDVFNKHGIRPGAVHLRRARTIAALTPLAEQLGIKLEQRPHLPTIEEARAAMPFGLFGG
jgi:hypothetical protein